MKCIKCDKETYLSMEIRGEGKPVCRTCINTICMQDKIKERILELLHQAMSFCSKEEWTDLMWRVNKIDGH